MRILLSDPLLVDDLREYLERCNCVVQLRGARAVEAFPSDRDVEPVFLQMELDAYLRVWRLRHPGAEVSIAA
jgi:hypothetical protein